MKPVSSLQHQPSPASIGLRSVVQVVAVEVEADLEPQRVAGAEPGRAWRRRSSSASQTRAPPRVEQHLDPVLARVAGAADQRRRRRRAGVGGVHPRRQLALGERGDDRARASGPCTASIA